MLRWSVLLGLSVLLTAGFELFRLPAALLLGPMIAAIVLASAGGAVTIPRYLFSGSQGVVGILISASLPASVFGEMAADWPIFVAGTASTLVASALLGWMLARSRALPGTTAIWGTSPGAATAMTLMSEAYGADMRLVAFMQYLRVAVCAIAATTVAQIAGAHTGAAQAIDWLPPLEVWQQGLPGILLAVSMAFAGVVLRIPGGPLLLPMAVGLIAKLAFGLVLVLPVPLLALGYALIGWGIGMRFTTDVLRHAARVFPRVLLSILSLVVLCGGFAAVLTLLAGVDPLTAYLATSPGGADAVAIIAASTKVDVPFVMSMQVMRFLVVLVTGPAIARALSRERKRA